MCISKHHPATIGLVQLHGCLRVCSVPSDFPQSPPTGTETTAQAPQTLARCLLFLFFDIHMHIEQTLDLWSSVVNKRSWHLMLSSEAGTGETVSFIYNQVRSLWLNVVTAKGEQERAETLMRSHKPTCTLSG